MNLYLVSSLSIGGELDPLRIVTTEAEAKAAVAQYDKTDPCFTAFYTYDRVPFGPSSGGAGWGGVTFFRPHRGGLAEAMALTQAVTCRADIDRIMGCKVTAVKPYGYDNRIGWDSHIVLADW